MKIIYFLIFGLALYLLSIIAWHLFLIAFRLFDNYMMDKHFEKLGYEKLKCEKEKTWYVK